MPRMMPAFAIPAPFPTAARRRRPVTNRPPLARSQGWSGACAPRRPGPRWEARRARSWWFPWTVSPTFVAPASREVPTLYVVTLLVSGLALIVNSGALVFRSSLRTSLLVVGVASVVGLSLALLFALSMPWGGALVVSGHPLDAVIGDLKSGFFDSGP